MGANHKPDTLFKLMAAGYQAEIVCRCGHRAMLDVRQLIAECQRLRIGINSFAPLAHRMKCSKCGGKPRRIGPAKR